MIMNLIGKRVLITGVGVKPLEHTFSDIVTGKPSHVAIHHQGKELKANIGAATALECARAGATVHMLARSEEKLQLVRDWILSELPKAKIEYSATDLSKPLDDFFAQLDTSLPLYWVQSVGVGGGTVQLKNDNPYLSLEGLSDELIEAELSVLRNTITIFRHLLPIFEKQEETRVCIVSSMSAVRSYINGGIHTAAKGAISRFANSMSLELYGKNIFITDIRPGGTDTGMYDSQAVQDIVTKIATTYGTDWSKQNGGLRLLPPSAVGTAIVNALSSEAHVTSVNLVGRGQWPHEGS